MHPAGLVTGNNVTVTYTGPLLHPRGEQVLKLSVGAWIPDLYPAGTTAPVLTLGDEPLLYSGGEQVFYSTADARTIATPVNRLTVTGATGGMPADITYTGDRERQHLARAATTSSPSTPRFPGPTSRAGPARTTTLSPRPAGT